MLGAALLLTLGGFTLLYAGFKGLDPRSLLSSVFTGRPASPLAGVSSLPSGSGQSTGGSLTGGNPAGGLTPSAVAFRRAFQQRFPHTSLQDGIKSHSLFIAGTTTISQHKYGNAFDIFGSEKEKYWQWILQNLGPMRIGHVIYKTEVWSYNNPTVHFYTGVPHLSHVHVDFLPQYCGTPPGTPC